MIRGKQTAIKKIDSSIFYWWNIIQKPQELFVNKDGEAEKNWWLSFSEQKHPPADSNWCTEFSRQVLLQVFTG